MIHRFVKLKINPENRQNFEDIFTEHNAKIAAFPGCYSVKLVREISSSGEYFTHSIWEDTQTLENYRNSTLFKEIWQTVKPWFAEKAQAWSTELVEN
jgi:quinol monooxygenase YgiN